MATMLGSLLVSLGLDLSEFRSGLSASEKELKAAARRIENVGKSMRKFGQTLSLAVTLPLAGLAAASIKAAIESKDALGQVNATLKSVGDAAGKTTAQLQALATSGMKQSLFDDDEILRKVTTSLLTFDKVSGQAFDRAQQAAIDLSAKFGGDLQSSALMVGKALQDPVKGMTALSKAGISFTEQQKEQVKAMVAAGNAAGAQKIVLAELEKQLAGSAAAARAADPAAAAKQSVGEAMEALGTALLPLLPPITEAITAIADAFSSMSPEAQKNVVIMLGLAAALGPVLAALGTLITFTAPIRVLLTAMLASQAVAGVLANIIPLILSMGRALMLLALNPVGLVITAIAVAVGAVYLAWKNWDKIKPILVQLYNDVKTWLQDKLGSVWKWVTDKIELVKAAFFGLYDAVVGNSYIPDMVDGIAAQMARLDAVMVAPAKKGTDKVKAAFKQLADDIRPLMAELFPDARALADFTKKRALLNAGINAGGAGGYNVDQLQAAQRQLSFSTTEPSTFLEEFIAGGNEPIANMEKIRAELDKLGTAANDNQKAIDAANVKIVKSFKDMADATLNALQSLTSAIKGGGFLDILGAVIGLGLQLGSIGAFGKKIQTNINKPVPGFASGTSFAPGGMALVGERGPELVNLPRGSKVFPSGTGPGGGGMTVHVEASPYFDVRVQQNINQAAPLIASAGGEVGVRRMAYRNSRRVA